MTTPKVAEVLTRRSYFNTFGGNPVCTAAGLAVLQVIERENLQENAHVVGSYLKERLNALKDKHESNSSSPCLDLLYKGKLKEEYRNIYYLKFFGKCSYW